MARAGLDPDPLKLTVRLHLAVIGACARDFRTAIEELHAVLDIEAEHRVAQFMLGSVYLWARRRPADDALRCGRTHDAGPLDPPLRPDLSAGLSRSARGTEAGARRTHRAPRRDPSSAP